MTNSPHTHVATIAGFEFFEHGTRGDESPLLVLVDGTYVDTGEWDTNDIDPEDVLAMAQYHREKPQRMMSDIEYIMRLPDAKAVNLHFDRLMRNTRNPLCRTFYRYLRSTVIKARREEWFAKPRPDSCLDSEGRWGCSCCGANMGGQYPHQYPDGTQVVLCEDCIEAVHGDSL